MSRPRIVDEFDVQIRREWLLTNGRGGFASGTVTGVPTRRYHGMLVASAQPPVQRWMLLSGVLEKLTIDGAVQELASFEFDRTFHPRGFELQTDFEVSNNRQQPFAHFTYEGPGWRVGKRIVLPRGRDEVWLRYRVETESRSTIALELCPFTSMRDFHHLTHAFEGGFPVQDIDGAVAVDAAGEGPRLWLQAEAGPGETELKFDLTREWWYGFIYREEAARGQDFREDLFVPGWFRSSGRGTLELVVRAAADFSGERDTRVPEAELRRSVDRRPPAVAVLRDLPSNGEETVEHRLREAADAFVVTRRAADGAEGTTILAGYHWFGDWGRDAFIALPGLLLESGRFAEARSVLETFAAAQQDGLIPNRFHDHDDGCDYNSVDASLWFIHAAGLYAQASGDEAGWRSCLGPACERVVEAFLAGTRFKIFVDNDGLVHCGDATTQLTWMDAKHGDTVFTPRHGKPVEINALWYHVLHMLADRVRGYSPNRAAQYEDLASRAGAAFAPAFWNAPNRCLFDVVRDRWKDRSVRPNQILAVSLPRSPLNETQQRAVLSCVECELLTPYGLRSLSWRDPAYKRRCEGNPFDRDSAYHQGTVWSWLIGPYVEAYLRLHEFSAAAKSKMRARLAPLLAHLDYAGIGSVSEIFDGDPPHTPRGCIAQAWSVAELLRAWRMTEPV